MADTALSLGIVAALIGAFVTNKLGASFFALHLWFGYAVIVLVVFRIVWGFVGTRHARFSNFVKGPLAVLRYISLEGQGRRSHYSGHNPLGALMILALLILLGMQATLGLFGNDEIFNVGPLAALVSKETSLSFTSLHRKLFYVILGAALLHIGAVLAHVLKRREPLIRAMITGAKPAHLVHPDEAIRSSRSVLAILLIAAITFALAVAMRFAPVAEAEFSGL